MPSLQPYITLNRPRSDRRAPGAWRARVKWNGVEHWLGGFATRAEAQSVEDDFRTAMEAEFGDG